MLDEEGYRNFFNQIHELWIEPEIERRRQSASLPEDFLIRQCLIRMPSDKSPIVEFNEEIGWTAQVKRGDEGPFEVGQAVYLSDIVEVEDVDAPEVDGKRVAFVYLSFVRGAYRIIFDFSPNGPDDPDLQKWTLGRSIAETLQLRLLENAIQIQANSKEQLHELGLWAAPILLPYPLLKMLDSVSSGNVGAAREMLSKHCCPEFIQKMTDRWWVENTFSARKRLIEEALFAHREGYYHLSISTLVPQVEGIISDWIHPQVMDEKNLPFRPESKAKKFRDLLLDLPNTDYTLRSVVESVSAFILDGPVMKTFKNWTDEVDQSFPGRHPISHGKYVEEIYTEENSVKVFLFLDTLFQLLTAIKSKPRQEST